MIYHKEETLLNTFKPQKNKKYGSNYRGAIPFAQKHT